MKGPIWFLLVFASLILLLPLTIKINQLRHHGLLNRKEIFNTVDLILLVISTLGILVSLLWDFNYLNYKVPIEYRNWKTITLNDFRGLKKPWETMDGDKNFAFISSSIKVSRTKNRIEIKSLFHPCRSYVFDRKLFSKQMLTHEMYHFHITEYCARLMRREVQDSINSNGKIDLRKIKNKILETEDQLQYQYDDETYHSYVYNKQIEWQNKIDSLLLTLNDFSSTILTVKK